MHVVVSLLKAAVCLAIAVQAKAPLEPKGTAEQAPMPRCTGTPCPKPDRTDHDNNATQKKRKIVRRRTSANSRLNLTVHLSIAGAALAGWGILEGIKYGVGPGRCRWCDTDRRGFSTLNPLDRTVRNGVRVKNTKAADWASHIVGFGVVSAGAAAVILTSALTECKPKSEKWRRLLEDLTMIVQAAGLSGILYQLAAIATGRPRPYAHFGTVPHHRPWDNISFFSGHVTYGFAVSAAATTVLWLRKSKLTPAVLSVGLALSLANGYLRIAADKHYFTDVLVGAAVGTLVGWAIPWLAKKTARPPRIGFVMGKKQAALYVGRDF